MSLQPTTTVRWVRASDNTKAANTTDETFTSKKTALEMITRANVSDIRKIGARLYAVTLRK